ncbi:MAG: hypothetical protein ACYC66_01215 [Chloroflexota bacterium]
MARNLSSPPYTARSAQPTRSSWFRIFCAVDHSFSSSSRPFHPAPGRRASFTDVYLYVCSDHHLPAPYFASRA